MACICYSMYMKDVKVVRLRQVGTSVVITVPVKLLEELEWAEGDQVDLSVVGWAGDLHLMGKRVGNNQAVGSVVGE